MSSFIYKITNTINSKFYIGKTTKTILHRFNGHKRDHTKKNTYLYKSMSKYGVDNFIVEQIEETDFPNEREIYWIAKLKPHYNMTIGGDGGDTSSSPNYKLGMKNRVHSHPPTYGMLGKKHPQKGKSLVKNCCPVVCDGKEYPSVGEAQKASPGISVRKRLDSPKYPQFYRLKDKTVRK